MDCQAKRAAPTAPMSSPSFAIRNFNPFKWDLKQRFFSSFIMGFIKKSPAPATPPLKMIMLGFKDRKSVV